MDMIGPSIHPRIWRKHIMNCLEGTANATGLRLRVLPQMPSTYDEC